MEIKNLLKQLFIQMVLLVIVVMIAAFFGAQSISFKTAWFDPSSMDALILWQTRLPRILMAAMVGAALASAGVAFQCLLRNPLADPFILGVSGGAALGSVVGIVLQLALPWLSLVSFLSAFSSMLFIFWLASEGRSLPVYSLLLTGVIFNSFTFAVIMLFNSIVSFQDAHRIWYLMVGGLYPESYQHLLMLAVFVGLGLFFLIWHSAKMNLLCLGEETALSLGCNPDQLRRKIFFGTSLMIGACVSVSGLIGFVGLFVPHFLRLLYGSDHRLLVPLSALLGASFLVFADTFARSILSGSAYHTEIPVGVITALLGGPFFVYLLKRRRRNVLW